MKKIKNILGFYSLVVASILILYSFGNGPAKKNHDKTGSPLSDGTCVQCHSGGSFNPSLDIKMYDGETEVAMYEPGKIYKMKYAINHVGNPARYGLQTTVLDANSQSVGTFDSVSSGFSVVELNGVNYIEHSSPSSIEFLNFNWTAPISGTGDVTFYSAALAANGNNNTSNDSGTTSTFVVNESTNSVKDDLVAQDYFVTLLNNPVRDFLRIDLDSKNTDSRARILSQNGVVVNSFVIKSRSDYHQMNVSNLQSGVYFLQISNEENHFVDKFIKN